MGEKDTTNYMAVYVAARMIWELTHDRNICEVAMMFCANRGRLREAEDWVADYIREKLNGFWRPDNLRWYCTWAIEHGYPDIIVGCMRRCSPGALDDLKWEIPPPYKNI